MATNRVKRLKMKKKNEPYEETKQNHFESNSKRNDYDNDEDKETYSIGTNSMHDWGDNQAENTIKQYDISATKRK